MRRLGFVLFVLAFWLPGCSGTGSHQGSPLEGEGTAASARERWEAAGLRDYSFDFQQQCFCVLEQVQPVTIEVRDGVLHRVRSRETGADVPSHEGLRWPTIPGLFEAIDEADRSGTPVQELRFDPQLGYPTHVEIGTLANDAGVIYTASNLRAD